MYVCITTPYKAKVHTSYWHIPADPVTQMTHMEWAGARKKTSNVLLHYSQPIRQKGASSTLTHLDHK